MANLKKWWQAGGWLGIFVIVLAAAALIQIWHGPKTWHTDSWPLTIVVFAIASPLVVHPELIKRLHPTSVKLLGVEVTFVNPYELSEEIEQPDPGDKSGAPTRNHEARWVAAQMKIQWKLAYLIKHTIPAYEDAREPGKSHVAFATIGSLLYDKYLDAAEAERLNFILTSSWAFIALQPASRRGELLAEAENLAQSLRAKVLKRMVLKDVKASPKQLTIEDEEASGKLYVRFPNGQLTEVWPTWGQPHLNLVKGRLSKPPAGLRIVVTPFGVPAEPAAPNLADGAQLVSLADFPTVLA